MYSAICIIIDLTEGQFTANNAASQLENLARSISTFTATETKVANIAKEIEKYTGWDVHGGSNYMNTVYGLTGNDDYGSYYQCPDCIGGYVDHNGMMAVCDTCGGTGTYLPKKLPYSATTQCCGALKTWINYLTDTVDDWSSLDSGSGGGSGSGGSSGTGTEVPSGFYGGTLSTVYEPYSGVQNVSTRSGASLTLDESTGKGTLTTSGSGTSLRWEEGQQLDYVVDPYSYGVIQAKLDQDGYTNVYYIRSYGTSYIFVTDGEIEFSRENYDSNYYPKNDSNEPIRVIQYNSSTSTVTYDDERYAVYYLNITQARTFNIAAGGRYNLEYKPFWISDGAPNGGGSGGSGSGGGSGNGSNEHGVTEGPDEDLPDPYEPVDLTGVEGLLTRILADMRNLDRSTNDLVDLTPVITAINGLEFPETDLSTVEDYLSRILTALGEVSGIDFNGINGMLAYVHNDLTDTNDTLVDIETAIGNISIPSAPDLSSIGTALTNIRSDLSDIKTAIGNLTIPGDTDLSGIRSDLSDILDELESFDFGTDMTATNGLIGTTNTKLQSILDAMASLDHSTNDLVDLSGVIGAINGLDIPGDVDLSRFVAWYGILMDDATSYLVGNHDGLLGRWYDFAKGQALDVDDMLGLLGDWDAYQTLAWVDSTGLGTITTSSGVIPRILKGLQSLYTESTSFFETFLGYWDGITDEFASFFLSWATFADELLDAIKNLGYAPGGGSEYHYHYPTREYDPDTGLPTGRWIVPYGPTDIVGPTTTIEPWHNPDDGTHYPTISIDFGTIPQDWIAEAGQKLMQKFPFNLLPKIVEMMAYINRPGEPPVFDLPVPNPTQPGTNYLVHVDMSSLDPLAALCRMAIMVWWISKFASRTVRDWVNAG
jgi:hypothetical protein